MSEHMLNNASKVAKQDTAKVLDASETVSHTESGINPQLIQNRTFTKVLKTTNYVQVSHLDGYLRKLFASNCKVIVEDVKRGSPIAKRLDMTLKDHIQGSDINLISEEVVLNMDTKNVIPNDSAQGSNDANMDRKPVPNTSKKISGSDPSANLSENVVDIPATKCAKVLSVPAGQDNISKNLSSDISSLLLQMKKFNLSSNIVASPKKKESISRPTVEHSESANLTVVASENSKCDLDNVVNDSGTVYVAKNVPASTKIKEKISTVVDVISKPETLIPELAGQTCPNTIHTDNTKAGIRNEVGIGPRRKAVVVGCSYVGDGVAALRGPCNDALLFATLLVSHLGFSPHDVLLLIDSEPAEAYLSQLSSLSQQPTWRRENSNSADGPHRPGLIGGMLGRVFCEVFNDDHDRKLLDLPEMLMLDSPGAPYDEGNRPTKANILRALRWLTNNTKPGDCGIFYFSGHGVQLDDLSGWEGEGYDEGLVPSDYMESGDPSQGIIPTMRIRQMLQSVDKYCQMTVILDATGLQTVLDPAGRAGPWRYIKGAVLRGLWPLADATGKVKKAKYDSDVWRDVAMQSQLVRPKFLPLLEVDCVSSLVDGFVASNHCSASANSICIAAAPWQEVALEALFKPVNFGESRTRATNSKKIGTDCETVVCHGVFTYCLVLTLIADRSSERCGLTVREIVSGINGRFKYLKSTRLPKLQQGAEATIHPAALASLDDLFAAPWGGLIKTNSQRMINVCNPFKSLKDGQRSFLQLSDAWVHLHQEGRARAMEQRSRFCRMRSVALPNGNGMVMMGKNDPRNVTVSPMAANMNARIPTNDLNRVCAVNRGHRRPIASNNWYDGFECPYVPVAHGYPPNNFVPMNLFPRDTGPYCTNQGYHYPPQNFVDKIGINRGHCGREDSMVYPDKMIRRGRNATGDIRHPGCRRFDQNCTLYGLDFVDNAGYFPERREFNAVLNPCRSNTSVAECEELKKRRYFDGLAKESYLFGRNNTNAYGIKDKNFPNSNMRLVGPITAALLSELPISRH